MSFVGQISSNTSKALSAGAIAALISYLYNGGGGGMDILGNRIPYFLLQGASVAGGVFITENISSFVLPTVGVKDAQTALYLAEPALTGLSSAAILSMITSFNTSDFLQEAVVGMGSTVGGVYLANALPKF